MLRFTSLLLWYVFFSFHLWANEPKSEENTIAMPVFSHVSGIYTESVSLHLVHPNPNATIVYTLDGSKPSLDYLDSTFYNYKNQFPQFPGQSPGPFLEQSFTSLVYSQPLLIADRTSEPNKISMKSSTWDFNPNYFPSFPVRKATVVRARAYLEDQSSAVATHTFFVFEDQEPDYQLPIVAIAVPENELFDYDNGIYTAGVDFDQWRLENPSSSTSHIHTPANFQRRGVETEKPSYFQYFVNGQPVMSQNIGIRIHGGGSRFISNKNLRLYARSDYDQQNSFDYPVFEDDGFESFKRFILRFDGRQNNSTTNFIRDHLLQDAVAHLNFDTQSYFPNILFLNGEYWGLYGLMTRYDKHYFERVYGIEEDELDYLFNNADPKVGDNEHYLMMYNYIADNDMSDHENFEYVETLMDMDNFTDYFISQIYMGNHDWPGNNINFFRKRNPGFEPDAPYGQDGRWRWLMADLDHGFGATRPVTFNNLEYATAEGSDSWANYDWATLVIRKLLDNEEFRTRFILRFADLINTTFLPARMTGLIDLYADRIAPEVQRHIDRWNRLNSYQAWESNVQLLRNYANQRPGIQRQHIIEKFNLGGYYDLALNVSDQNHGYIRVNTIDIHPETPGVWEQAYPWSGTYFNDMPLTLKAVASSGFSFSHWEGDLEGDQAEITLNPNEDMQVTAHFIPDEGNIQPGLIYYWVMTTDIPNNTPLTSLQASYSATENTAELMFESALDGYPYYEGHPFWRKSSMERRNAPTHVNYMPEANNGLEYGQFAMRGLQVKQPFATATRENTLLLNANTTGYTDIKVSFAVLDEGAAQGLIFDYLDNPSGQWTDVGLNITQTDLTDHYQQVQLDLSQIAQASHNPEFMLRIRFLVQDGAQDNGERVTFNNMAVKGIPSDQPLDTVLLTLNVDMSFAPQFDAESDTVFVTGTMKDFWQAPGSDPENQMMQRVGESMIFTRNFLLEKGAYAYKYYINSGWEGAEWAEPESRLALLENDTVINDLWGHFTLELLTTPPDGGTVSGEGIYSPGHQVSLSAQANDDFSFLHWADHLGEPIADHHTIYYEMPAENMTLQAHFDFVDTTESLNNEKVKVYPNPATHHVNVVSETLIERVILSNMAGEQVFRQEKPGNKHYLFNTSPLKSGMYLLQVITENDVVVVKLQVLQK